jgi:hypothetical protein
MASFSKKGQVRFMSGRIAKSQIPLRSQTSLPPDAKFALITAKNALKAGALLRSFGNTSGRTELEGPPLPDPSKGCAYYEVQVGQARPGDPKGEKGQKRLVLEVNTSSKQILETYYTEEHYAKFTFFRIT